MLKNLFTLQVTLLWSAGPLAHERAVSCNQCRLTRQFVQMRAEVGSVKETGDA
jgi:hypothetical protein